MPRSLSRAALHTHPVTFHIMLLAMAYGVDRFNADVLQLLQEAHYEGRCAPAEGPTWPARPCPPEAPTSTR